jgi:hypothetical protein
MPKAVMSEIERNEVFETMIANEQSRQLSDSVEGPRGNGSEFAANLVRYADDFSADVQQRVWHLIRQHPEAHSTVLSLLRTVITRIEKERAELKARQSTHELRELAYFEAFVRRMGRDILCMTRTA